MADEMSAVATHQGRLLGLIGEPAFDATRSAARVRVHELSRSQAPLATVDGIGVDATIELDVQRARAAADALLAATTWNWEVMTRHRALPDTLIEIDGAAGRAVFILDRRGAKLGIVAAGHVRAADYRPASPGGALLETLANAVRERREV